MKSYKWMIVAILSCVFVIAVFFTIYSFINSRYVWNYFSVIGIRHGDTPERVIRSLGEPNEIISPGNSTSFYIFRYDSIDVIIGGRRNPYAMTSVQAVRIFGCEFRFGRHQIGVGSTIEEIEHAYRHFSITPFKNADDEIILTVVEGRTWVSFFFDEDKKVIRMSITYDGP